MAASEALLSLELNANELVANMLQMTQAGKRYLLLQIVSEGITAKEIAKDAGDKRAEKQPSVEQGLEGEAVTQRERLPPGGTQITHTTVDKRTLNYGNLYGDLSAGSGCNALKRDPEYAVKFLNEFQDRLFFGTDICRPDRLATPLVDFLLDLRRKGKISETVFQKVARENAIRLLRL